MQHTRTISCPQSDWKTKAFGRGFIALFLLSSLLLFSQAGWAQEEFELADDNWQRLTSYPANSPEGKLQAIRKLIAETKYNEAEEKAKSWIGQYPDHPMLVEAYLLSGDAKTGRKYYYKALYDYEKVISDYPASEQYHTALEREYQIGRLFLTGTKRRLFSLPIVPADGEGEELMIRIQERAPGSALAERASLFLADYFYDLGDMKDAAEAYDLFLTNYPESLQREWAMLRLIRASLARFKGPEYDPTGLVEAQTRLLIFEREFPASAERIGAKSLLTRISESLALKDIAAAEWYAVRGNNISAAVVYRRVVQDYPQTTAAQTALSRLASLDIPNKIKLEQIGTSKTEYIDIKQAQQLNRPQLRRGEQESTAESPAERLQKSLRGADTPPGNPEY
ncbi:outer membrane protein assembly factor BamD [Poriferisphaera sp. WC338]|uniref:outer membrane protein assembly factor BamD n=1 Tax=Poriferisphaera sp. WC338 TaxID=3425129 RepID=UPI003D814AB7